jgi:hypothetical protein
MVPKHYFLAGTSDAKRLAGIPGGDDGVSLRPQDAAGDPQYLGLVVDDQNGFHGVGS